MVQVREQQAQEANEAQVGELKEAVKAAQEEAADLHARLATVVPRDQLTAAEQRIKVRPHQLTLHPYMRWLNTTEYTRGCAGRLPHQLLMVKPQLINLQDQSLVTTGLRPLNTGRAA